MWMIILFGVNFVLELIFNVALWSLREDSGEGPESLTTAIPTLTRKLVWPKLVFHPHYWDFLV